MIIVITLEGYRLEGEIQGHHVYKCVRTPVLGQVLDVQAESTDRRDRYAVSILQSGSVVASGV